MGWETMNLTELVTVTEHCERTLEYDCKQEITKLSALQLQQLQGQRPI